jgi:uncharacterized protein YcfJ
MRLLIILTLILIGATSCTTSTTCHDCGDTYCNMTRGQSTAVGTVLGATAGAIIGHQKGRALEGMAIGAGAGAILGNMAHKDHRCRSRCHGHRHGHHHHHRRVQYFIDGHGCKVWIDECGMYRGCSVVNPYKRRTYYNPLHD